MEHEAIKILKNGGIGVMPTDTIYGIVASAFSETAIERIYTAKGRQHDKPFIILISSVDDLVRFGAELDVTVKDFLMGNWPGPLSVIISVPGEKYHYLHRGKQSLAFRMPASEQLQVLLRETGPLASTSVNPEGEPPAHTIEESKKYFGDTMDFYIDGGELSGEPSTIVDVRNGKIDIVRQGAAKISYEK